MVIMLKLYLGIYQSCQFSAYVASLLHKKCRQLEKTKKQLNSYLLVVNPLLKSMSKGNSPVITRRRQPSFVQFWVLCLSLTAIGTTYASLSTDDRVSIQSIRTIQYDENASVVKERKLQEWEKRPENNWDDLCSKVEGLKDVPPQCQPDKGVIDIDGDKPTFPAEEKSVVSASFRVGFTIKIRPKVDEDYIKALKTIITNGLSFYLRKHTPFHVPRQKSWQQYSDERNLERDSLSWAEEDKDFISDKDFINDKEEGEKEKDPDGNTFDPDDRKINLWLHHLHTGLRGRATEENGIWFYPIEIKYLLFRNDRQILIRDADKVKDVSKTIWKAGNYTAETKILEGKVRRDVREIFSNRPPVFIDLDPRNYQPPTATPTPPPSADPEPTIDVPNPNSFDALSMTWGIREWIGLSLFLTTTFLASLLTLCSWYQQRSRKHQQNWTTPFLTEEGIQDILQIGWKFHQESGQGQEVDSQLFLQVYNKSKVGYNDDSSVLMGGIEQAAVANTEPITSTNTDTYTSRDTITNITNQESLNSGENSFMRQRSSTPSTSDKDVHHKCKNESCSRCNYQNRKE